MGLGVVGSGVAQTLFQKAEAIAAHVGQPVLIQRILVRDPTKGRSLEVPPHLLTSEAQDILDDPKIAIVVEVLGGEYPATDYIYAAIDKGKHVVTANKEVMAKHGPQLLARAAEQGISVLFEASVGGGIPIIGPLRKDLLANEIQSVHAIINGTTNYILTRMSKAGVDFQTALREAQALGYAEPDPTDDVEGIDAAYKLAVLATLAFHTRVKVEDVYHEGITRLEAKDFRYAQELGYTIKLLAMAKREGNALQVRVHPTFISLTHPLANVDGVFNAVEVEGDLAGKVMFHGQGAGSSATSSAVVADIVEIARGITSVVHPVMLPKQESGLVVKSIAELTTQYYLRLSVIDKAGVLAQIARILGELNVSIASVIQKETNSQEGTAEIVITTHLAQEASVQEALAQLARPSVVQEVRNFVRVENGSP